MLNWAARYYPILRILRKHNLYESGSLLEVGAGPYGIGTFRKVPFVGCDLSFPVEPSWPMKAVIASATELPFRDAEFDVVLASDVMEHIPTDLRIAAIRECLRVTNRLAIFGFPSGQLAWKSDHDLLQHYLGAHREPPIWLKEHMDAPFPEADLFVGYDASWDVQQLANESIKFHSWLMRSEMSPIFVRLSSLLMRRLPGLTEWFLRHFDREPSYRKIFVLTRHPNSDIARTQE